MDTIETIMTRKSVRQFTSREIREEDITAILKAGMSGPSCANRREWSFLVVKDRETLNKMADANGGPATPLRGAALGILACGDLERAFQRAPDYWVIDVSIAVQNMILAATDLGIGSVWLGTWPQQERVKGQAALFALPETIIPHSIVAFGYPAPAEEADDGRPPRPPKPEWEADRVHFEKW